MAYQLPVGKLTGFAYLLDFDEAPRDSSQTLGLRFTGERPVKKIKLAWLAVVRAPAGAREQSAELRGRTTTPRSSPARSASTALGAGYEVLEGDGVKGFTTPLATLHKFDGWADKFLTTPPNGLERRYVTLGLHEEGRRRARHASPPTRCITSSTRTAWASTTAPKSTCSCRRNGIASTALLKYADYNADSFATDTSKYWAEVNYVW